MFSIITCKAFPHFLVLHRDFHYCLLDGCPSCVCQGFAGEKHIRLQGIFHWQRKNGSIFCVFWAPEQIGSTNIPFLNSNRIANIISFTFSDHPELFESRASSFSLNAIYSLISAACPIPDTWKVIFYNILQRGFYLFCKLTIKKFLPILPECFWLARVSLLEESSSLIIYQQLVVARSLNHKLVASCENV